MLSPLDPHLRRLLTRCAPVLPRRVSVARRTERPPFLPRSMIGVATVLAATLARRAAARADPRKVGADGVSRNVRSRRGGRAHGTGQGHRRRRAVRRRGRTADAARPLPAGTARARSAPSSAATPATAAPAPCTLDGQSVKSLRVLAVQADGGEVTTIEGLARDGQLHPMQKAFNECHALQCGFCTPGHDHGRGRPARARTRTRARTRSARASRATSAAAPATRTSCAPCSSAAQAMKPSGAAETPATVARS